MSSEIKRVQAVEGHRKAEQGEENPHIERPLMSRKNRKEVMDRDRCLINQA
jgi:hypothetical protein